MFKLEPFTKTYIEEQFVEGKRSLAEIYENGSAPIFDICEYFPHLVKFSLDIIFETKENSTNKNVLELTDINGWGMIHYISKFSTSKIIKHAFDLFVENNLDILKAANTNWNPLHTICKYQSLGTIKYVIDICIENKFDIVKTTNTGWAPIHFICRYQTLETIKYIVDVYNGNDLDITASNNKDWAPIHDICRYSTLEIIKYMIDIYNSNSLDLTTTNRGGWAPIHIICRYQTFEAIKYIVNIYVKNKLPIPGSVEIYDGEPTDYHTLDVLLYINPHIQEGDFGSELDEIINLLDG